MDQKAVAAVAVVVAADNNYYLNDEIERQQNEHWSHYHLKYGLNNLTLSLDDDVLVTGQATADDILKASLVKQAGGMNLASMAVIVQDAYRQTVEATRSMIDVHGIDDENVNVDDELIKLAAVVVTPIATGLARTAIMDHQNCNDIMVAARKYRCCGVTTSLHVLRIG